METMEEAFSATLEGRGIQSKKKVWKARRMHSPLPHLYLAQSPVLVCERCEKLRGWGEFSSAGRRERATFFVRKART